MKYCLLKIAYDDTFNGFQVQPDVRTVQGEILSALKPIGIDKVYASSRTDSHVRACSNIIEVMSDDCKKVCRIVDSIRGIIVIRYSESDKFIRLRGNISKHYLYVHPESLESTSLNRAIQDFLKSNYSLFSRDPEKRVILDSISYEIFDYHTSFIFAGRSFSWNFVRVAVENIIQRAKGKINDDEWDDLLSGKKKFRYKGKAENLILLKAEIGLEMIPYNSDKLNEIRDEETRRLYWIKGLGIDLDTLFKPRV